MLWLFILVLGIVALMAHRRITELENQVRNLTSRLYYLEWERQQNIAPPPVQQYVAPAPEPEPERVAEPQPVLQPEPVPEPTPQPVIPQETARQRLRRLVGDEEWESLVGGSVLNKVGALVLVVGIALLLGYSFTQMGAAGRVAVSLCVSGALLGGGLAVERRERYRVFSWGLLGAGWAGLYSTVYAMYAVDAARVIDSAALGTDLQLAVAACMIGHSLRYRVESVTGVAAAGAFAALALTPAKQFGVGGLVPLSAALIFLAVRMRWHAMALFSLLACWGTVIGHGDQGAPLVSTQTFLFVLWLIFEAFDIARLRDAESAPAYASFVLPLNAAFALGLSYLKWEKVAAAQMPQLFAGAALLYLAGALVRGRIKRDSYRTPIVLASALAALAIVREAGGAWAAALLAVEAEILFLAARRWRLRFVEYLAAGVFACAFIRLLVAAFDGGTTVFAGVHIHVWTPAALWIAALCYINRELRVVQIPYGYLGSVLVQLVLGAETPDEWMALVWTVWVAVQLEAGLLRKAPDLRRQAYGSWVLAAFLMFPTQVDKLSKFAPAHQWLTFAGVALLGYAMAARLFRAGREILSEREASVTATIASAAAGIWAMCACWCLLPDVSVALAWMALALLLIEAGLLSNLRNIRIEGHAVALLVFARLFVANFTNTGATLGVSHRLLTVVPIAACFYYLWHRCRESDRQAARGYLWLAAAALAAMLRFEFGRVFTVVGWSVFGLILLVIGLRQKLPDLRYQSFTLALMTTLRCIATDFDAPESFAGISGRLLTAALVITLLYLQEFLLPREWPEATNEVHARSGFSLAATLLLSLLLYREVSGSLLTMAWGLQGLLLLAAGFPLRERVLRLSGLLLLLFCIGKLFFYDLRNLETLPRIFSFMALGVILLGVSWAYTRFREHLKRLL